jgi:hypothetical protein
VVKCNLCNEEFANSEEVKSHKEQVHPMGDGKDPLKANTLMEKPGMREGIETNESDMPEPAERRNR